VDAEEFEALCMRASESRRSTKERIRLLYEAVSLYKGDFLPKQTGEIWVIPLNTHYHALYLTAVKELTALLEEMGRHEDIVEVCSRAIEIDNLDEELYCHLVRALVRLGRDSAALSHYEAATELLYRNLGVRPSEELRSLYREIMKTQKTLEMDLGVIQEQLKEHEDTPGAFCCEYGFFKEAYRLEARQAVRSGRTAFIALLTVSTPSGEVPALEALNDGMDHLFAAIRHSLRKGDVVARYSGSQYVIMLSALTFEDGEMVMSRILSNYYKRNKNSCLKVNYKLQQLFLDL